MEEQTLGLYILTSLMVFVSSIQRTQHQELFTEYDTLLLPLLTIFGCITLYIAVLTISKTFLNIVFKIMFVVFGYWSIIANMIYFFEFFEYEYEEAVYGTIVESEFEEILIENENKEKVKVKSKKKRSYIERFWRYCKSIYTTLSVFYITIYCIGLAAISLYIYTENMLLTSLIAMSICYGTIRIVKLDRMVTGYIHLAILFIYDLVNIFLGPVMEKNMDGIKSPIFLAFPHHFHGYEMIGLGDVFIPGLYISLVKKFCDMRMSGRLSIYWWTFFSYNLGLAITLFFAWITQNPKPAMLIISPLMILVSGIAAMCHGCFKKFVFFSRDVK